MTSRMTVSELISRLEDMDPDAEVRWAAQPSWAFEYSIDALETVEIEGESVVYLSEGEQLGYLPGRAAVAIGWRSEEDLGEDEKEE